MRSLLAAAAVAAAAAAALACTSDADCNLNGSCQKDGTCTCLPWWTGDDCGALNLLPAVTPDAALYQRANTSSWCAGVVQDDTGTWHLYVAVMSLNCGLNSWQRNSVIVHAASTGGVLGPYVDDTVIMPAFAHNPKPIRAPDGTYLIFHIGCGNGESNPIGNCSRGVTPTMAEAARDEGDTAVTCGYTASVLASASPSGPWQNVTVFGPPPNAGPFPTSIDNPSPLYYSTGPSAGGIGVMYRSYNSHNATYHSVIGIATAATWQGPYDVPTVPIVGAQLEDPFFWYQAETASYHALFHTMGGA